MHESECEDSHDLNSLLSIKTQLPLIFSSATCSLAGANASQSYYKDPNLVATSDAGPAAHGSAGASTFLQMSLPRRRPTSATFRRAVMTYYAKPFPVSSAPTAADRGSSLVSRAGHNRRELLFLEAFAMAHQALPPNPRQWYIAA